MARPTHGVMELTKDKVYRVESVEDTTVKLALCPHVFGQELRWFDTVRARVKPGRVVSNDAQSLVWQSADGAKYRFTVLTLAVYQRNIRGQVELTPNFASDADLHRFYVNQFAPMTGAPLVPPPGNPASPAPSVRGASPRAPKVPGGR